MHRALSISAALVVVVTLSACDDDPSEVEPADAQDAPADTPDTPDRDVVEDVDTSTDDADEPDARMPVDEVYLAPTRSVTFEGFATAPNCADCHSNAPQSQAMRDSEGEPIGFYDLWRASMMANASRDPFWRAMVSAETAATPPATEAIEDKCMNCHAPMAYTVAHRRGAPAAIEMLHDDDELAMIALDGVSCTTCHKVEPDNFGEESSFSGGFILNVDQIAYGPHENPFAQPMINRSGFEPIFSEHVRDSELCATCHTLHTDALDPEGNVVGDAFPEQSPYLEWQNSDFNTDTGSSPASCQSCHVPQEDAQGEPIATRIARRPNGGDFPGTQTRQPVGRHLFIGGNTLVPGMLRDHADALNPQAPPEAFDALIDRVRDQLSQRTARVEILSTERTDGNLQVVVEVENLTGHRFPTGFPSRRAWLHLSVRDAQGAVVFESGGWDAQGRLIDAAGEVLPIEQLGGPIEPHRTAITAADQVQVYEPIMAGLDDQPTYTLLRAVAYHKDNRLLPKGWSPEHPNAAPIGAVGTDEDPDFEGGRDRITYDLDLAQSGDEAGGELDVEVELVYQVLGARFAAEIFAADTEPMRVFRQYYEQAERGPEFIGGDSARVQ